MRFASLVKRSFAGNALVKRSFAGNALVKRILGGIHAYEAAGDGTGICVHAFLALTLFSAAGFR
jgi:hypothetical protein